MSRRVPLPVELLWCALRRRLLWVRVTGASMEPTLYEGDVVLCVRSSKPVRRAIVVREVVIGTTRTYHVKRLLGMAGDTYEGKLIEHGSCWVEGDNRAASTDSRHFGPLACSELSAVAIASFCRQRLRDLRSG